jgi:hypothetical protein
MRETVIFMLLTFLTSSFAFAGGVDLWKVKDGIAPEIELNDISFSNRARCALDSKKPAKSAFVIIDNVNPAKAIHRFATSVGLDQSKEVKRGVSKFRYSVYKLTEMISNRLLSGDLPLLKSKEYSSLALKCRQNSDCSDLYSYVERIWNKDIKLKASDYLPTSIETTRNSNHFRCHYLKKFSPIQAHLLNTKPTAANYTTIGKAVTHNSTLMASCDDVDAQKDLKVSNYQIELSKLNTKSWDKYGFEFWDALKVYFSWAYRYSDQAEQLFYPFSNILKSVSIEESVIFIPNGCKSITKPSCDGKSLSMNSMRFFARSNSENALFGTDLAEQIPLGPEQDLLNTPITDVNVDILNLGNYDDANQWSTNFRNNFTKARGFMKLKLIKAVNHLSAIKNSFDISALEKKLEDDSQKVLSNSLSSDHNKLVLHELYYMCSEFIVASSEKLSFIREDVELLSKTDVLNSTVKRLTGKDVQVFYDHYTKLASMVRSKCAEFEKKSLWGEGAEINRDGFHSWYKELIYAKGYAAKTQTINDLIKHETPILRLRAYEDSPRKKNVVCMNGSNCSRLFLDSLIDLYAVVKYSNTLIPLTDEILSPSMLNPMAERTSCGVYDPWSKTRHSIFQFFQEVASGALFGLLPSPVYVSAAVDPKKPISFNTLVENGLVRFDPQYSPRRVRAALSVDFGAMLGVPCNITVSNSEYDPQGYYAFGGISVQACRQRENNNMTVMSASDISNASSTQRGCFSCAINLRSVTTSLARVTPFVRVGYFLARGVYNLYRNLKDPDDIPRSWDGNLRDISYAYRKLGEINKSCTRKLRSGKHCLKSSCETEVVRKASMILKEPIVGANINISRTGYLKVKNCKKFVKVNLRKNRSNICSSSNDDIRSSLSIPRGCEHLVKESKSE